MNDGSEPAQCSVSVHGHFQEKTGAVHVLPPSDERRMAMLIGLAQMVSCFAPHMGEELYTSLTGEETVTYSTWPTYDEKALVLDAVEIAVQINGKVKTRMNISSSLDRDAMQQLAYTDPQITALTEGKTIVKVIAVPGRLLNIVVK